MENVNIGNLVAKFDINAEDASKVLDSIITKVEKLNSLLKESAHLIKELSN